MIVVKAGQRFVSPDGSDLIVQCINDQEVYYGGRWADSKLWEYGHRMSKRPFEAILEKDGWKEQHHG
jgi:hypothetical protein